MKIPTLVASLFFGLSTYAVYAQSSASLVAQAEQCREIPARLDRLACLTAYSRPR